MQARFHLCVGPRTSTWLLTRPTTLTFCLSPTHFFTTLCTCFGLPHPMVAHFSWCQCGHAIDYLGTHLLWCLYESEDTTTHDTFRVIIIVIVLVNGTHVQREVSHLFLHHTQRQVDILIIKDDFWTLMDIVIAYLIHTNMMQWTLMTTTQVMMMVV
jgi:hypothetical protein